MVSIHGPLGYEPNTLTTAPLRSYLERFRENKKNPAIAEKNAARRNAGRRGNHFLTRKALWGHAKSASNPLEWLSGLGFLGCGSMMRDWGFEFQVFCLKVAQRITPGKVVRTYFFPERRLGGIAFRKVVRSNYSQEGGSAELPPESWFGGITPGKVVRTNYFPEGGSAELPSGRWCGPITLRKVVRPYVPSGWGM